MGWSAGWGGLEVCGVGAGKISQITAGVGRVGFKVCGCGAAADKKLQSVQDSNINTSVLLLGTFWVLIISMILGLLRS